MPLTLVLFRGQLCLFFIFIPAVVAGKSCFWWVGECFSQEPLGSLYPLKDIKLIVRLQGGCFHSPFFCFSIFNPRKLGSFLGSFFPAPLCVFC